MSIRAEQVGQKGGRAFVWGGEKDAAVWRDEDS